jgi:hypothetical protein
MVMSCARRIVGPVLILLGIAGCGTEGDEKVSGDGFQVTSASHSWNGYHWARTANPFTLQLGDNVSSAWDSHLGTTSADWSVSEVLDTAIVAGANARPRSCKRTNGRVEVCSSTYGFNGWLGVATVWVSGSHITAATVKVNDSYFNTATYGTPAWRNLVMCQEVGHTLGLDHQDEAFDNANLGTCMDYTNDPESNQHPNAHDYAELTAIYSHLDGTTTVGQALLAATEPRAGSDGSGDDPSGWGRLVRTNASGKVALYELDLGGGFKVFTFVILA